QESLPLLSKRSSSLLQHICPGDLCSLVHHKQSHQKKLVKTGVYSLKSFLRTPERNCKAPRGGGLP
ncbi:hypothetical protein LEMLEM_LOCUS13518, partial [Lemmus lemmus]